MLAKDQRLNVSRYDDVAVLVEVDVSGHCEPECVVRF